MTNQARRAANELAEELVSSAAPPAVAGGPTPERFFAVGDPQGPADSLFSVLDGYGLLGDDGRLLAEVGLLSVGDHFDYHADDVTAATREGVKILRWLAEHPLDQVPILIGNHDVSRVSELVGFSDERFAEARSLAERIAEDSSERQALAERFHQRFPSVPAPQITRRDYSTYAEAQRELVAALIASGRMQLSRVARLRTGEPVLATHAGVTMREVELLGAQPTAASISSRLAEHLDAAVAAVRPAWNEGRWEPIDLAPLHVAGVSGSEGGGLLYHRPADPRTDSHANLDVTWGFDASFPRRFDPRRLPLGLVQLCGHTKHQKAAKELQAWLEETPNPNGRARTLSTDGTRVRYATDRLAPVPGEACLYMIDGDLSGNPDAVELFELGGW